MHTQPPRKRIVPIIAAGPLSPRTKSYLAYEARLVAGARLRHAGAAKAASLLGRIRLELKIGREVRAELKKRFPHDALYGVAAFKFRA